MTLLSDDAGPEHAKANMCKYQLLFFNHYVATAVVT